MGEDLKPSSAKATEGEVKKTELNNLEECRKQKDEYLAGWQRERADFLNYKKEEMERIGELLKYAGEEMVLKLLPILDNFELAEKSLPEDLRNNDNIKGLLQIKNQIIDFLKNQGVEEIKTAGEKFDPNYMEAVEKEEEERKGYKINGRLLRPAKIKSR
ncbi:MAG: nucleotide exchange factor GrpE [Candidatus Nealsonbacteria bacterium RIFCSPLOWO2_01_FULL_41_9]|uniref:Protein GrpE n=1 Tax=Candidatus Nealsonbacteria bacterium RIFCSPLOWO2_01_FULL_41_9 TaxID=1801671 RepID=A0A1G2EAS9_9BACT|nr:MAG: nucleotide exchange factor GrpE [Candidatus Nealsonbacteria bacterium RIFCSPLOWO2_01_FULL_41_9]